MSHNILKNNLHSLSITRQTSERKGYFSAFFSILRSNKIKSEIITIIVYIYMKLYLKKFDLFRLYFAPFIHILVLKDALTLLYFVTWA